MGQAIRAHYRQLAGGWGGGTRVNTYFKQLGFENSTESLIEKAISS